MTRRFGFMVLLVAAMIGASFATPAAAQNMRHSGFGVEGLWGSDSDFGVGARAEVDLSGALGGGTSLLSHAFLIGTFDYYFPDCGGADCTWWEINPSLAIPLRVNSKLAPYIGAGLNYAHSSVEVSGVKASGSDTGLNVLGGVRFPIGGLGGFAEARWSAGGSDQIALTLGVLFGGH